jgi:hypothetical protein
MIHLRTYGIRIDRVDKKRLHETWWIWAENACSATMIFSVGSRAVDHNFTHHPSPKMAVYMFLHTKSTTLPLYQKIKLHDPCTYIWDKN